METKRILILEDDIKTLAVLMNGLRGLEEKLVKENINLSLMLLSEYTQVEKYLNNSSSNDFDLVLLDRDCKAGGSFHVFNIEQFCPKKIIAISSVPEYNEEAKKRGVIEVVYKDYSNLENFVIQLIPLIKKMIL